MRLYLIIWTLLVASCGRSETLVPIRATIPPDLLVQCEGWQGGPPQSEGAWARAAAAEMTGRIRCNVQLGTIAEIDELVRSGPK